jgi:RES domain-containing protein
MESRVRSVHATLAATLGTFPSVERNHLSRDDAEVPPSGGDSFGEGSYRYGGRWNSIGSFRAVYGSTDDVVALNESKANALYANLPYPFREPRLIVAVEMSLSHVVDLTASGTLKALGLTQEDLCREDWRKVQEQRRESFTQALGRAAFATKAEGLLARSARVKGGTNVVYFPENKASGSEVWVWEARKLRADEK